MDAQGSVTNAKEDTVYLATGGAPATDLSQLGTNLTSVSGGAYETGSLRANNNGSSGRELYVRCTMAEEGGACLLAHSETTGETNLAYYWVYRAASGGAYYNDTTDANDAGTNDTWLGISPGNSPGVNDARYIASLTTFNCVTVDVSTAYVASQTLVLEYWNGATWVACRNVVDRTSQYTVTGKNRITFDLPDDWAITSVNGQGPYYWVRHRVSSHTSVTTLAMASTVKTETIEYTYGIETNADGQFCLKQGTGTIYTETKTALADGDCHVHWSTRPNPDTTGASDALISEIAINYGGTRHLEQFTHATPSADFTRTLSVGGWYNGSGLIHQPGATPTAARIGRAYRSHVEFEEDWIGARSAHSGATLETLAEPLGTSLAGAQAEWAGQANVGYLAAQARELRGRALSPLVNEVYHRAWYATGAGTTDPLQWLITPPGASSSYKLDVTKLRWVAVPPGIRYAWVRVQLQSYVGSGSAVPVHLRCYAMNRPHVGVGPSIGGHPTPALKYHFAEGSLTVNDISTAGRWVDLGLVPLPVFEGPNVGWTNTVHLCLAHAFDPEGLSSNDANAYLRIRAWHVRPVLGEIG